MVTSVKFDLELKPGFDGIDFDTLPEFQKNPAGIELSDGNGMYIPIVAGKLNLEANKASFIYTFNGLPGDGAKNIKIVLAAGHLGLNMPLTLVIPEGFLLEKDLYIDIATIDG